MFKLHVFNTQGVIFFHQVDFEETNNNNNHYVFCKVDLEETNHRTIIFFFNLMLEKKEQQPLCFL